MDISKNPLLQQCYDVCLAIEKCGASRELTKAVAKAGDLMRDLDKIVDAVGVAYGYLWHVNNDPGTPMQYPPERASYEARRLLRDTLTKEHRGKSINAVRQIIYTETDIEE